MIRLLLCGLAAALLTAAAQAQDVPQTGPPVAAAVQAVKTDYQIAQQKLVVRYQQTKDEQAKERILDEYFGLAPAYVARCLRLAQLHPGEPAVESALGWAATLPGKGSEYDHAAAAALTSLVRRNSQSPALLGVMAQLQFGGSPALIDPLRVVYARAKPNSGLPEQAGLALAQSLRRRYEKEWQAKKGSGLADYEEAEKVLTALAAKEPPTGRAREILFLLQHLSVGKPAPEIAAQDLDGVSFKLSDYRGKVVVLDFWGNW